MSVEGKEITAFIGEQFLSNGIVEFEETPVFERIYPKGRHPREPLVYSKINKKLLRSQREEARKELLRVTILARCRYQIERSWSRMLNGNPTSQDVDYIRRIEESDPALFETLRGKMLKGNRVENA